MQAKVKSISQEERITLRIQELNSRLERLDFGSLVGGRVGNCLLMEVEFLTLLLNDKELIEDSKNNLLNSRLVKRIIKGVDPLESELS